MCYCFVIWFDIQIVHWYSHDLLQESWNETEVRL